MTGRNRRASTSSVETVDEAQVFWRQETSVLKSVPANSDSNYWPIFELRDAVILNKDGHALENALEVRTKGPFIVRGNLIIDDPSQKQHLIMRVRSSVPIEVRQSRQYSIGEAEDGQPLIWVSGKGGWYEIIPSPAYLPIYNKMCEAAMLYYHVMDICKKQLLKKPKKGKRTNTMAELAPIFHKYAASIGDGSTLDEVIKRCEEHAEFLMSQFELELDFDWRATPFYKWMTAKHHDLLNKALQRRSNPPAPPRSPSVEIVQSLDTHSLPARTRTGSSVPSITRSHPPPHAEAKARAPRERSTRSQSTQNDSAAVSETPDAQLFRESLASASLASASPAIVSPPIPSPAIGSPAPQDPEATAQVYDGSQTPFESVLKAFEEVYLKLKDSRHGMTVLSTLNKVYFTYKFPNYREGGPGSHKIPVEEVFQYNAKELLRVIDKDKYSRYEVYAWLEGLTKKEFKPVAIELSNFPYALIPRGTRPRPIKNTEPVPSIQTDGVPTWSQNDDASSTHSRPSSQGSKRLRGRPKKSNLRPMTGSKKRLHSELDSDFEPEDAGSKKSHYFDDGEDVMGVAEAGGPPGAENTLLPDQGPVKIIIRADKIPSAFPHGPHDTWVCDEEDCGYVVRGGDVEHCQERIRDHFQEHEEQIKRVNLAMSESRGQLPIKYAYFPPFLIIVELHCPFAALPTTSPSALDFTTTTIGTSLPAIQDTASPRTIPSNPANPSASDKGNFRSLVNDHLIDKLKSIGEKSQRSQQLSVDGIILPQPIKRNLYV
ncbi:hypothetical protein AK830_g4946 [Neonectria ditissima]|uniref:DNA (cytosine-5)-methyltransferase 1 replication foci domain-containing protein n=1 Tax=Neonectria ditissima TaxID=78410 RepID=A0A0P7B5B0_9HYPO|nr:hypothetical protein AK830_g4946 [Neonectria ditissima]